MEEKQEIINVRHVKKYIFGLVGQMNTDEGIHEGNPETLVKKIMVCWMADVDAIEYAANTGANLIITHESLFYPYDILVHGKVPEFLTWRTNQKRISLLCKNDISVIRAHGSLDKICIFDEFASVLQIGTPLISEPGQVNVFEITAAAYGEIINRVKSAMDMKILRVTKGNRDRLIKRIGLPWGGLGLFVNVDYMQRLVDHGCELFIAGETDNYGFRFAIDAGIDMIETSHETSENPGLKHFTDLLRKEFSRIPVEYYENKIPWMYA